MGIPSCPGVMKPYGDGVMGIPEKAIGEAGNMLCMGCIAPGMANPGGRAGIGVPPGPIIAYGIPCIICSRNSTFQLGTFLMHTSAIHRVLHDPQHDYRRNREKLDSGSTRLIMLFMQQAKMNDSNVYSNTFVTAWIRGQVLSCSCERKENACTPQVERSGLAWLAVLHAGTCRVQVPLKCHRDEIAQCEEGMTCMGTGIYWPPAPMAGCI